MPIAVRLPPAWAAGRASLQLLLSRAVGGDVHPGLVAPWRLSSREVRFARRLLRSRRQNLWLWRTHQQRQAGDFLVVDLASPDPARRPVWVLDLKLGRSVVFGGGGAGNQLVRAAEAVRYLVDEGVLATGVVPIRAVGDFEKLLELLRVR